MELTLDDITDSSIDKRLDKTIRSAQRNTYCKWIRNAENKQFKNTLDQIVEFFKDDEEIKDDEHIALGKPLNPNSVKFQKRREALQRKADRINQQGKFQAQMLNGELLVKPKSLNINLYQGDKKDFSRVHAQDIYQRIQQKIEYALFMIPKQLKEIRKQGLNHKITITKGNKLLNIDNDATRQQIREICKKLVSDEEWYDEEGRIESQREMDREQIKLNVVFYTGAIGNGKKLDSIQNKNIIISPNTLTRCISDSLAIVEFLNNKVLSLNIFASVKELSHKLALEYNLVGGGTFQDIKEICKERKIKVYDLDDEITEHGLLVIDNHCVVICPKTDFNTMFAEILERQYYSSNQKLIKFKKGSLVEGKEWDEKRPKIYMTYDFEWTYDKDQLDNAVNVDQFPYAYSLWVFSGTQEQQQPQKYFGLDCGQKFVEELSKICQQHTDCDIILYAHNGQKSDYPLITKYLPNFFKKDNVDFASKMTTLSYNWNIGEQRIQFQDALNLFPCMSLENISNVYGVENKKLEAIHADINLGNWQEQCKIQNLEDYIVNDVLALGQAIINYDKLIKEKYGFQILGKNNLLSNSTLAFKVFFSKYYKQNIYQIPDDFFESIFKTYHGGSTQAFILGHLENQKIFAIDINSSYPGQMVKQQFPLGPYYKMEFGGALFSGQQIPMGCYEIFIKDSPKTNFPVFFTTVNGTSQPSLLKNTRMWVTSEEVEYAFKCGYKDMFLIQGIISRTVGNPFTDFIMDHYAERAQNKKQRDQHPEHSQQWYIYECLQALAKNMMNSSYGKFALNIFRQMNELTSNEKIILDMIQKGTITSFEEVNINDKKFYQVGGIMEQKSGQTNIMLASFITAYGRVQLNKIQRDIELLGLQCVYSDTDSVYFRVNPELNWTNKQINDALDKLGQLHCHKTEIGKCKYETADDVGNCLEVYNKNIKEGDEPLRYCFADEAVILALKSYALKSNITGETLLKGKGIPVWMFKGGDKNVNRAKWNNNERQFNFDNFVDCADKDIPFVYKTTQFMVQKKQMYNEEATHLKVGRKMTKKVTCAFTQKNVAKGGLCIPKIYDQHHEFDTSQAFKYSQVGNKYDYVKYSREEDIKAEYNIQTDDDWKQFKSQNIIIADSKNNWQKILFRTFEAYQEFFNDVIKPIPILERHHHQLNGIYNQQFGLDIDIKDGAPQILEEQYGLTHKKIKDQIVPLLIEFFKLPQNIEFEIIDRTREGKISFHIRFNCNTTKAQFDTLKLSPDKQYEVNIVKNPKSAIYAVLPYIDSAPLNGQLRITTMEDKYLFNPRNFPYQALFSKKQIKFLEDHQQGGKDQFSTQTIKGKYENDQKLTTAYLKENKLDHIFHYSKSEQNPTYKSKVTIKLGRKTGVDFNCPHCKRVHTHQECIFLEVEFNNNKKIKEITLKCYKYLVENKEKKLKESLKQEFKQETKEETKQETKEENPIKKTRKRLCNSEKVQKVAGIQVEEVTVDE